MRTGSAALQPSEHTAKRSEKAVRIPLALKRADVVMPLLYLLCLSATGLFFYPALIGVLVILLNRWRKDRYDFIIMLTLLLGDYGFLDKNVTGIFFFDIALVGSLFLWFAYRKPLLLKKILALLVFYAASIFILASMSIESMSIQILTIRTYLTIFCLIIPIVVFGSPAFDSTIFFRKTIIYALIICSFYIIDGIILCGNILLPRTTLWVGAGNSSFFDPIWNPGSFVIFRKYPTGLYIFIIALYPMAKMFKLTIWQWVIVIGALICSQTFTVLSGVLGGYMLMRMKFRHVLLTVFGFAVSLVALYFIDGALPEQKGEVYRESALRVKSSVDQFITLYEAVDDEDLAQFASGRVSQILPKFDVMGREGRMWIGLGFLHREKSKINRYIIENEYYTDIANNLEVATGIEVVPAQIMINMGIIGLIIHTFVFFMLWFLIRKFRYSGYVLSAMLLNVWFGLMGFAGLISFSGIAMMAITYGVVLAVNYKEVWGTEGRITRNVAIAFLRR